MRLRTWALAHQAATNGAKALEVTTCVKPDLVITDVRMQLEDAGLRLLAQLRG